MPEDLKKRQEAAYAGVADEMTPPWVTMGSRTWYFDEKLREAMDNGVKQVVVVGVGLDCRTLRIVPSDVTIVEVDEAPVLEYKLRGPQQGTFGDDDVYPRKLLSPRIGR